MGKENQDSCAELVVLRSDNGSEYAFCGQLYSESSHYDDETGGITRLRLFISKNGEQVFSIISGAGTRKHRRHYIVRPEGDMFSISDGKHSLTLPQDMLFASVFGLCGIDPERAEEIKPAFEESLRMIVG